jgi:tetratricopeptide (TPR) repeat protein
MFCIASGARYAALRHQAGWLVLSLMVASMAFAGQGRPSKPALIRDTDTAEGKDVPEVEKEKVYNPLMAEKAVKVGNYYFKRKNYSAAIQRYLEALEYQPERVEAFDALGRAYEKNGEITKAIEIYRDYAAKKPDAPKTREFRSRIAKLTKKS